jgi:single-strand DNA-binding protein
MPKDTHPITVTGNLTGDPALSFTPTGKAVAKFGVAVNKSHKEGEEWVKEDAVFWNVTVWEDQAERVVDSLKRGDRVTVYGKREEAREYEKSDGGKGVADHDITAYEVSASLKFNAVEVQRPTRELAGDRGIAG